MSNLTLSSCGSCVFVTSTTMFSELQDWNEPVAQSKQFGWARDMAGKRELNAADLEPLELGRGPGAVKVELDL